MALALPAYLTTPPGVEAKNLPLVLLIHGGPWYRDSDNFDPEVQLLANRGYAVLQVNYRGSTGFGLKFLNAGTGQWGRGTQEDLYEAVQWAIDQGIADPKRDRRDGLVGRRFCHAARARATAGDVRLRCRRRRPGRVGHALSVLPEDIGRTLPIAGGGGAVISIMTRS